MLERRRQSRRHHLPAHAHAHAHAQPRYPNQRRMSPLLCRRLRRAAKSQYLTDPSGPDRLVEMLMGQALSEHRREPGLVRNRPTIPFSQRHLATAALSRPQRRITVQGQERRPVRDRKHHLHGRQPPGGHRQRLFRRTVILGITTGPAWPSIPSPTPLSLVTSPRHVASQLLGRAGAHPQYQCPGESSAVSCSRRLVCPARTSHAVIANRRQNARACCRLCGRRMSNPTTRRPGGTTSATASEAL